MYDFFFWSSSAKWIEHLSVSRGRARERRSLIPVLERNCSRCFTNNSSLFFDKSFSNFKSSVHFKTNRTDPTITTNSTQRAMSSIRSAISLLLSSILALTFIASSSAQVTPGNNVTSIAGTWSTGSGGVSTGLVSFVEGLFKHRGMVQLGGLQGTRWEREETQQEEMRKMIEQPCYLIENTLIEWNHSGFYQARGFRMSFECRESSPTRNPVAADFNHDSNSLSSISLTLLWHFSLTHLTGILQPSHSEIHNAKDFWYLLQFHRWRFLWGSQIQIQP